MKPILLCCLIVPAVLPAATLTWDSSSPGTSICTAGNWVENTVPADGDIFIFPSGLTGNDLLVTGDVDCGSGVFQQQEWRFLGGGYTVGGEIQLQAGALSTVGSTVDSFRHDTSSNTINATVTLTGASEGVFGFESNGGTITYNGAVECGKHTLVVAGAGTHRFNARTGEPDVLGTDKARLVKRGTGRAHFTAAANFGRGAAVNAGELFLEGSAAVLRSQESVTVAAAAELTSELGVIRVTGAGTGRTISLLGTTTTGTPTFTAGAGLTLESTGNAGSPVEKIIGGTVVLDSANLYPPGGTFAMIRVAGYGAVTIPAGAVLNATYTGSIYPGQRATVIDNQATDSAGGPLPITGTFSNKPDGFVETVGGIRYGYDYSGGDGNDLVITVLPPLPTGTARTWNGTAGDTLWNTTGNWAAGNVPARGDEARFTATATAANRTVEPRFVPLPVLHGLTVTAPGYTFAGDREIYVSGTLAHTAAGTPATQMAADLIFTGNSLINLTGSASFTATGRIRLPFDADEALTVNCQSTSSPVITLQGTIEGEGKLIITGSDAVVMSGTPATPNSYTGVTQVNGKLRLERAGQICLQGDTIIPSGTLTIAAAEQIADSAIVTVGDAVASSALFAVNADEQIALLSMDGGTTTIGNGSTLTVSSLEATTSGGILTGSIADTNNIFPIYAGTGGTLSHLSGSLSTAGYIELDGGGTMRLGAAPASGSLKEFRLTSGTLEVTSTAALWDFRGSTGTMLTGSGQVGSINRGVISPMTISPGTAAAPAGRITSSATTIGGPVFFDIRGNTAGTTYDQISLTAGATAGTLQIGGGVRLHIVMDGSYIPPVGQVFTIVDNDLTDAVTGTFADHGGRGLPEGSIVTSRAAQFRISYIGGTGNDVTLTVIPPTQMTTGPAWKGASTLSDQWSEAANWFGDRAPLLGETLHFSDNAARLSPQQNLTGYYSGAILHSGVAAAAMNFTGTEFGLTGSFSFSRSGGDTFWNIPLKLMGPRIAFFRPTSTATNTLIVAANVDLRNNILDLRNMNTNGLIVLRGGTSNGGTIEKTGPGAVRLEGASVVYQPFSVAVNDGTLVLSSSLDTSGTVAVNGGTLRIEGTGLISPIATLQVNGANVDHSATARALPPTVLNGGTLTGATVPLFEYLTLAENTSSSAGGIELLSGGTFLITLNATQITPLLTASGNVILGNAQLNTRVSAAVPNLALNQTVTLISKTSAGPVTGTFSGLAQTATFTVSGQTFRISYTGGDGNDVTLTKVSGFTAVTPKLLTATVTFSGGTPQNPENARFQATWQASGGQNGMLQHSTGLDAWTTVALVTASGAGIFTVDQTLPYAPRRFFRIVP